MNHQELIESYDAYIKATRPNVVLYECLADLDWKTEIPKIVTDPNTLYCDTNDGEIDASAFALCPKNREAFFHIAVYDDEQHNPICYSVSCDCHDPCSKNCGMRFSYRNKKGILNLVELDTGITDTAGQIAYLKDVLNISEEMAEVPQVEEPKMREDYNNRDNEPKRDKQFDSREKEEIKSRLIDYVNMITEPSRRAGGNQYICPICKSGTGRNHTGAFTVYPDTNTFHCFSCNSSGDIFNLLEKVENITEFPEQIKRLKQLLNMSESYKPNVNTAKETQAEKEVFKVSEEYKAQAKEYINNCAANVGQTDYLINRGLSPETIERFKLGYDPEKELIVIPYSTDGFYYSTRATGEKEFHKPKKTEAGTEPPYNKGALYADKPCFITESALDAISIMQANNNCNAVALNGTGCNKLIEAIKDRKTKAPLIISLDNDEPGREGAEELSAKLSDMGIAFIKAEYNSDCKDANDMLIDNAEQLAADIEANINRFNAIESEKIEDKIREHTRDRADFYLRDFIDGLDKNRQTEEISTGWPTIDAMLGGGLYPGLYIFGGLSSIGKTSFMLQMCDQIAESGTDVLYFSLEMSTTELISKSLSRYTYILSNYKKDGAVTALTITTPSKRCFCNTEQNINLEKAIDAYCDGAAEHLYFYEGVGDIGVEEIKDKVSEHIELTGNKPLVFVDYLQILAPHNERATDKQNTDKAVLELKRMSRDYNLTVFAISSLNRENYSQEISLNSFKESGAIEYGSDCLLGIQAAGMISGTGSKEKNREIIEECKQSEEREITLKVLKMRNGKTGGHTDMIYNARFNHVKARGDLSEDISGTGFIPAEVGDNITFFNN